MTRSPHTGWGLPRGIFHPWLRPLADHGWVSGSLLLGQQICKPQVSSIYLGEKKKKEKKIILQSIIGLPNPSRPQGLAAAQGPKASGSRNPAPKRGSGVPLEEQTQPGVAC